MRHLRIVYLWLIIIAVIFLLSGCAPSQQCNYLNIERQATFRASSATAICNGAQEEHREKGQWPDNERLAVLGGTNLNVYTLKKPYHSLPAAMDPKKTFAFYGYYCSEDSSYYTYCRLQYTSSTNVFEIVSTSSGVNQKCASIYSIVLDSEQFLIQFYTAASQAPTRFNFDELVEEHALLISKNSPNLNAKQKLFEFAYQLLPEYYNVVINLPEDFQEEKLNKFAWRLGYRIHNQW